MNLTYPNQIHDSLTFFLLPNPFEASDRDSSPISVSSVQHRDISAVHGRSGNTYELFHPVPEQPSATWALFSLNRPHSATGLRVQGVPLVLWQCLCLKSCGIHVPIPKVIDSMMKQSLLRGGVFGERGREWGGFSIMAYLCPFLELHFPCRMSCLLTRAPSL